MGNINIRQSSVKDIPRLLEIFATARRFMLDTGNPDQWAADYPDEVLIKNDIESRDCYVCLAEGRIVGTFVLRGGNDPTYNIIYDGKWQNNLPYATIHRIASSGDIKGIMHHAMQFALQRHNTVRIDTHRDNKVMQNAILKEGFIYCGIIHCWNGSERMAYQFTKPL